MELFARRRFLALSLLAGGVFAGPGAAFADPAIPPQDKRRIYIQPIGTSFRDSDLAFIEGALLAFYDVVVERLSQAELPRSAFYSPRQRYRAERLLDFLGPKLPPNGHRILGLTGADISTTKGPYADWGVMGLANLAGTACVLSSFRCQRGATSARHALVRFAKTAVHELGHTFGLPHCTTPGCLMEDGKGSVFTTDHEYDLCETSRSRLVAAGYELSRDREIPWPKPSGRPG
jgi:archaemetzincin